MAMAAASRGAAALASRSLSSTAAWWPVASCSQQQHLRRPQFRRRQLHATAAASADDATTSAPPPAASCVLLAGFHPAEVEHLRRHGGDALFGGAPLVRATGALLDALMSDVEADGGAASALAADKGEEEHEEDVGRVALYVGECRARAAALNGALLSAGLLPAVVGAAQPKHAAMTLRDALAAVRAAHAAYHALHTPLLVHADGGASNAVDATAAAGRIVLNVALDQGDVPTARRGANGNGASNSNNTRVDASHVVVIDGLLSEPERAALLAWLTADGHDHSGPPPPSGWERACVDRPGDAPTWGLRPERLRALVDDPPPALLAVNARLAALYPEYDLCYMPAAAMTSEDDGGGGGDDDEEALTPFVANAVVYGDPCCWHADADPSSDESAAPGSPWVAQHGYYANRERGRPLFVSALLYLNKAWEPEWFAETLFADPLTGTGVFAQPRPGRCVLMEQDLPHRISAPSPVAPGPRYSLVWKLVFVPKASSAASLKGSPNTAADGGGGGGAFGVAESIARPEWGPPLRLGSADARSGAPAFGGKAGEGAAP